MIFMAFVRRNAIPLSIVLGALMIMGAIFFSDDQSEVSASADSRPDPLSDDVEFLTQSALRSAALAQEAHFALTGTYAHRIVDLETQGLRIGSEVNLTVVHADETTYCMEASHPFVPGRTWFVETYGGGLSEGLCGGPPDPDLQRSVEEGPQVDFCIKVQTTEPTQPWYYDSSEGEVPPGMCL
jgi:hypothetical protein